jgi:hypothetical protein
MTGILSSAKGAFRRNAEFSTFRNEIPGLDEFLEMKMASLEDSGCMKIDAISSPTAAFSGRKGTMLIKPPGTLLVPATARTSGICSALLLKV